MTTTPASGEVLGALFRVLEERRRADPATSYVAGLYARGLDRILEKVGEEATETLLAAKNGEPDAIIRETADLWFHTLVMLAHLRIPPERVLEELVRRFGHSGLSSTPEP